MTALAIGITAIRQFDNLCSLNDLHKVSGNQPNHAPAQFMRKEQTKALVCNQYRALQAQQAGGLL